MKPTGRRAIAHAILFLATFTATHRTASAFQSVYCTGVLTGGITRTCSGEVFDDGTVNVSANGISLACIPATNGLPCRYCLTWTLERTFGGGVYFVVASYPKPTQFEAACGYSNTQGFSKTHTTDILPTGTYRMTVALNPNPCSMVSGPSSTASWDFIRF